MSSMDAALAEIESLKPGEDFQYFVIADKHGVNRSTLSRRHRVVTTSHAAKSSHQQSLSPQQERELVRYIEGLTERHIPPTREMIRNFASNVAKKPVSESWVTRFINQYSFQLTSQWTVGMDAKRHQADSGAKYSLYFDLLQSKITKYNVEPHHTYNMDKKGFLIRITSRLKRVLAKGRTRKRRLQKLFKMARVNGLLSWRVYALMDQRCRQVSSIRQLPN